MTFSTTSACSIVRVGMSYYQCNWTARLVPLHEGERKKCHWAVRTTGMLGTASETKFLHHNNNLETSIKTIAIIAIIY